MSAAHRYPKGLVARDAKSAQKVVYQKLKRVSPRGRTAPMTPEMSLMKAPIGSIDALVQTLVASRELRKETLLRVLSTSKKQADYARGLQVAKSYTTHSGRRLMPHHVAQVLSCAVLSQQWSVALQMYVKHGSDTVSTPTDATNAAQPKTTALVVQPKVFTCSNPWINLQALRACRPALRWIEALRIYHISLESDPVPSSHLLSSLTSVLRHSPRWDLAFSTFTAAMRGNLLAHVPTMGFPSELDQDTAYGKGDGDDDDASAEDGETRGQPEAPQQNASQGFRPSYALYRKIINLMYDRRVECPTAWMTGLKMIQAVGIANMRAGLPMTSGDPQRAEYEPPACVLGPLGVDVGLANLAIRLSTGRWRDAVNIFMAHTAGGVLCDTHCNEATFEALSLARPTDPHYQSMVFTAALRSGISATARLFERFFAALHAAGRSDEALATFYRYYDVAIDRPSDIAVPLSALYDGMIASLLRHPSPDQALVVSKELRGSLEGSVVDYVAALTTWGEEMQRWTADGRVLVIDAAVLSQLTRDSIARLQDCFDSIVIPFTVARSLMDKFDECDENDKKALAVTFHLLSDTVHKPAQKRVVSAFRVLPFLHQLQAHTHLTAVRDAAQHANERSSSSGSKDELRAMVEAATPPRPQIGASTGGVRVVADPVATWVPKFGATATRGSGTAVTQAQPPTAVLHPPAKLRTNLLQLDNTECHPAAVAVMLKRLNPDAHVSVMVGSHWSRLSAQDAADILRGAAASNQVTPPFKPHTGNSQRTQEDRQKAMDERSDRRAKSIEVIWYPTWNPSKTIHDAAQDEKRKASLQLKALREAKAVTEARDVSAYRAAFVEYSASKLAGEAASIPGFFHPA